MPVLIPRALQSSTKGNWPQMEFQSSAPEQSSFCGHGEISEGFLRLLDGQ